MVMVMVVLVWLWLWLLPILGYGVVTQLAISHPFEIVTSRSIDADPALLSVHLGASL